MAAAAMSANVHMFHIQTWASDSHTEVFYHTDVLVPYCLSNLLLDFYFGA